MWDKFGYASAFSNIGEIEFHVRRIFLEFIKKFLWRRTHDVMNLDHLIKLIVSREQRE